MCVLLPGSRAVTHLLHIPSFPSCIFPPLVATRPLPLSSFCSNAAQRSLGLLTYIPGLFPLHLRSPLRAWKKTKTHDVIQVVRSCFVYVVSLNPPSVCSVGIILQKKKKDSQGISNFPGLPCSDSLSRDWKQGPCFLITSPYPLKWSALVVCYSAVGPPFPTCILFFCPQLILPSYILPVPLGPGGNDNGQ